MEEGVSRGFENTADGAKGIETSGKNPKRMSESDPMVITTRFQTRFAAYVIRDS